MEKNENGMIKPIMPYDFGRIDTKKILKNISTLLMSDRLTNDEKEDIKLLGNIFVSQLHCSICQKENDEIISIGMIRNFCEETGSTTRSWDDNTSKVAENCPIKKIKF